MNNNEKQSIAEFKKRLDFLITEHAGGKTNKFSALTGITYQTITNWIKRETSLPGAEHIINICWTLDVDANWFLIGEGDHKSKQGSKISLKEILLGKWEMNPAYFESNLEDICKRAFLDKIENTTQSDIDSSDRVVKKIKEIYDEWTEALNELIKVTKDHSFLLECIGKRKEADNAGTELPEDFQKRWDEMIDKYKTREDDPWAIESAEERITNINAQMQKHESEINTLLSVFT